MTPAVGWWEVKLTDGISQERICRRRFTPDDLHALAAIRADADVMKYTTGRPKSVEEVQTSAARGGADWAYRSSYIKRMRSTQIRASVTRAAE